MRRESRAGKLLGHLPEPCCDVAAIRVGNAGFRVFGTSRRAVAERTDGVTMLTCDVTDDVSVAKLVEEVLAEAGRIDLLVNNAGICPLGGAEESSTDQAPKRRYAAGKMARQFPAPFVPESAFDKSLRKQNALAQ